MNPNIGEVLRSSGKASALFQRLLPVVFAWTSSDRSVDLGDDLPLVTNKK